MPNAERNSTCQGDRQMLDAFCPWGNSDGPKV